MNNQHPGVHGRFNPCGIIDPSLDLAMSAHHHNRRGSVLRSQNPDVLDLSAVQHFYEGNC